jgi:hypothetical protein
LLRPLTIVVYREKLPCVETAETVDFAAIGRAGAALLEDEVRWIHRRVESLVIGPETLVRRRVSFDFTIPAGTYCAARGSEGRDVCYLPVSVLQKAPPVINLDLVDESGRPFPLLTRRQNAVADSAALVELARRVLAMDPDAALIDGLHAIVWSEGFESLRALVRIVQPSERSGMNEEARRARHKLADSSIFVDFASQLVSSTLLWVPVIVEPGRRRITKMAYDVPTPNRLDLLRTSLAALGWGGQTYWIDVPHVGNAASYHLTISTPEYLEVIGSGLEIAPPAGSDPALAPVPDVQIQRRLAHLYVTGARTADEALAWITLRVERRGFLVTAALVCAAIAAMLGIFTAWSGPLLVESHLEPTVTVLLVVPAVLVAFLATPTLKLSAQRLLVGVRALVALQGMAAVLAALAATAWSPRVVRDVWLGTAIGSGAITAAIIAAVRYPRRRQSWNETV